MCCRYSIFVCDSELTFVLRITWFFIVLQAMEVNSADVLEGGESLAKFLQVAAKGKGMAERSRGYVRTIGVRYVQKHQQHLFAVQAMRRSPDAVEMAPVQIPTVTTSQTNDLFTDDD